MLQRVDPPLVLASASVSRRSLLSAAGLEFSIRPAAVDEAAVKVAAREHDASARTAALQLADLKASTVARDDLSALVIGADQILLCDGEWFDKPADSNAAHRQLRSLRGRTHTLATAVVCWEGGRRVWHHVTTPRLTMRDFSDAFLADYLAAEGDALTSSVGAYRLEGLGVQLFSEVVGEHSAILGLPLLPLLEFLRKRDILLA